MISTIRIAILLNLNAGQGNSLQLLASIREDLQGRQVSFDVWQQDWTLEPASYSHIYLIGGDGTLNYFINKFPECKTPISLFNAGTGNDFFWKLYGEIALKRQLEIAFCGDIKAIDAGKCNGRLFINGAGIGFDGAVVKEMKKEIPFVKGLFGYYFAVIKSIFKYRSIMINFDPQTKLPNTTSDDAIQSAGGCVFMVAVANGARYGGDFLIAPQACLSDGYLDLVSIGHVNIMQRLFYLPRMKKGRHLSLPFVYTSTVKSLTIKTKDPVPAHLDGELMIAKSFEITTLPEHFNFRC